MKNLIEKNHKVMRKLNVFHKIGFMKVEEMHKHKQEVIKIV